MKRYLLLLVLYLFTAPLYAQTRVVKGTVSSDSSMLSSVSVFEKDVPANGAVTNEKGEFTISLRGKGVLVFHHVGYLPQEMALGDRKNKVDIRMVAETKTLDDVVVIGYGTKKKITNTGAVSAISGAEIRETPTASVQNALVGRLPGYFSQQRSGQPGSDGSLGLIRGLSTITNDPDHKAASPLVIVDDLEYGGPISEIDPDQVESISILKDASTTAVYGIKGANGVIIITTRRGKIGRPQVSFRSEAGAQAPTIRPHFLDSYNSALLRNQALVNDSATTLDWTAQDIQLFKDGTDPYGHPNIDWWNTLIRPYSLQLTNTLNMSGGTEKTKYFVSAGYLWQNGMVKNFSSNDLNSNYYYKRYNFRSNLDIQATKTLQLNLDLSGNYSERNEPNILGRNNRNKVLFEINDYVQLPPFAYQPFNPNGTYGANPSKFGTYSNNVIGRFALGGYNRSFDNDVTLNFRGTQKLDFITKGLSAKVSVGYNAYFRFWRSMTRTNFPGFGYNAGTGVYTPWDPNVYEVQQLSLGYYADAPNSYKKINYQGSLNYDRTFNGHHVYALGLFNQTSSTNGIQAPFVFRGLVVRAGYDYKQKYLVEFNGAYNGSSVFAANRRYSWFPAVSAGWNVAKEDFFSKNLRFVDVFKIRASLGVVGSDNLPNNPATNTPYLYAYQQVYMNSGSYSVGNVSRTIGGIVEGTLGTDITWEKERQGDIGVDIKMFNNKLSITADYFDRERYDILITRGSVSTILGVGVPPVNLARVENKGYEIEAIYNGFIKQFTYSFRGNISVANNKILFQDEAQPAYPWLLGTGHHIGYLTGYTYTGFYSDYGDIAKSPVTQIKARPGDLKYADLNGDNKIDQNDQRIMKYTNLPNTNLGFTTTVGYKGISLSLTLQSALNFVMRRNLTGNYTTERLDSWTPTNTHPLLPRLSVAASVSDYDSDFWYRRMDYLRLKTINLGYQLPTKFVQKYSLSGIRVYASAYNLFTWMLVQKNIYDFDPEAPTSTEGGEYPVQKVVNMGIQITF